MLLWKNIVVMTGLLAIAWLVIRLLCENAGERRQITQLAAAGVALTLITFSALPLPATLLLAGMTLALCASGSASIAVVYLLVTALVPIFEYRIPGFLGLTTFITLTMPVTAGAVIIGARAFLPGRFAPLRPNAIDGAMICFIVALVILSTRGQSGQVVSRVMVENAIALGGAYLAGSRARLHPPRSTLLGFAFLGLTLAMLAVFEAIRSWPLYDGTYAIKGVYQVHGMIVRQGYMRSLGPFADPLAFSIAIASAALAGVGLFELHRRRTLTMAALAIMSAGLAFTFSRTGLVAFAAGLVAFAIVRRKTLIYVIAIPIGGLGVWFVNAISSGGAKDTSDYRLRVLSAGWNFVLEHPLTGDNMAVKQGQLKELVQGQGIVDIVNSYIQLGIDGGFLLIASFVLVPLMALARYVRQRRRRDEARRIFADVAACQLIGMMCALAFTSLTDKNLHYVLFTSGLLIAAVSGQARSRAGPPARHDDPTGDGPEVSSSRGPANA